MVTIAIRFGGTKFTQCLQVDHAHKAIVGGVFPDHFFYWCSMIWLSSFTSKSRLVTNQNNYRENVRNTLTETIGMVFSMERNDIIAPSFLTTEPNKHNIAGWRMRKREATVLEVNQMEHTETNRTKSIFANWTSNIKEATKWIRQHPRIAYRCCKVVASRFKFWSGLSTLWRSG